MSPNSEKRVRHSSSVQSRGICPTNILIESASGSLVDPLTPFMAGERLDCDADPVDTQSLRAVDEEGDGDDDSRLFCTAISIFEISRQSQ